MYLNPEVAQHLGIKEMREHQNFFIEAIKSPMQNIFFVGPRQIGKTTAIFNLMYYLREKEPTTPIYFVSGIPNLFKASYKILKEDFKKLNITITTPNLKISEPDAIIIIDEGAFIHNENIICKIILKDDSILDTKSYSKLIICSTPRKGSMFNMFCLLTQRGLLNNTKLCDLSYEYPLYEFCPQNVDEFISQKFYDEEIRGIIL